MLRPRAIYAALRSARDMSVAAGARMRARTEVGALPILLHMTAWYMCATEEVAFKPAVYASTFLRYGSGLKIRSRVRFLLAFVCVRCVLICRALIALSCVDPKRPATPHVACFTAPAAQVSLFVTRAASYVSCRA